MADELKFKISSILFSLYPFFHNFRNFKRDKIIYNSNNGVIINNRRFNNESDLTNIIINLISVNPNNKEDVKIDGNIEEILKNNRILRFHIFLYNFINILVIKYKKQQKYFDDIYKIYNVYVLNKINVDTFIKKYKTKTKDSDVAIITNELKYFKQNTEKYKKNIDDIINSIFGGDNDIILDKSFYDYNEYNDTDNIYTFRDFIEYLNNTYKELVQRLEKFTIEFAKQIEIYKNNKQRLITNINRDTINDLEKEGFNVEDLRDKQDIKEIYKYAEAFINNYIEEKETEDEKRYKKVKLFNKKDKSNLKLSLAKFHHLLDINDGRWRKDIIVAGDYEKTLRQLQYDFSNLLQITDYDKFEISVDYYELDNITKKLKNISELLKKKQRISSDDNELISNFDNILKDLEKNPKYIDDKNFKQELNKVKNYYKDLFEGENKDKIKETIENTDIIRKDTIYFDTNIAIFKLIFRYMIMFAIVLVLIILLLSFLSVIILLYDILIYFITLFINPNLNKAFTIDYLTKNMVNCTKNNYDDDRYLIFTVQIQNLNIFTLTAYIFYLLLGVFLFYLIHVLYSTASKKFLKGSIYDIDRQGAIIILFIIILLYSVLHLTLYKILFKPLIYTPYKEYKDNEITVDKLLDNFILIKTNSGSGTEIIVDNNFFKILFDLTRIDELNTIFLNGIKDNNSSGCLEQKIIIYDLYMYLKEHISFDEKKQNEFKAYCTSNTGNKPPIDKDNNKQISFISLLNNSEVRMIKKYHEELDFFNNIPDDKIEYYNELNKNISGKLKQINENIITYNKTLVPFFLTILYIFGIFFLTAGLFYILINYVLMGDAKMNDGDKFNYYFVYGLYKIKTLIYDKIIKLLNW